MEYSRETLVAELRKWGITYLAPSDAISDVDFASQDQLLTSIINQNDSRLRLALIPLFIRYSSFAQYVPSLSNQLDTEAALDLQTYYMAAVYLQRLWKSRLGLYLQNMTLLPDLFSQSLGLPSPEERFGKLGLYDLADAWQARSRYPFNRLAAFNKTIDLFFEQLKLEKRNPHYATKS
ncbi:MAG: hypothetical protein AAF639_21950 [Chloroflexota bacterium]